MNKYKVRFDNWRMPDEIITAKKFTREKNSDFVVFDDADGNDVAHVNIYNILYIKLEQ